ncbi:hypothetical protein MGG_10828 [Pyricularia oryzae 70-15]|uniref:SPT2 chromatin protein n=3 Tax=Pyricularia oryzae TaxID=318829 RepID=G4MYW8_PYRO7|nr:uncharacterized protein MGG_10828 [Pyricularia oryzae 70-15]EHA53629.1 hypothetical protein MGG_10828 [Pyricularia oryzae 70-15]ELQ33274.1 hypothetical protein OOU_Y34scaffold00979g58 [Pyricularia oryzae Y34]KAI7919382.1 hypothetical protein M9X92_006386 [Pyricularia oryzae]KAI7926920.1 hypothetical protein M0657_003497 [Pyricularia oryzae]
MPIVDLLASITGEKPKPADASKINLNPKRKADDDLRNGGDKLARTVTSTAPRKLPVTTSRPTAVPTSPLVASISRPTYQGTSDPNRRTTGSAARGSASVGQGTASAQRPRPPPIPARPVTSGAAPKTAPKKGSFAEIMARAAKAQQSQGPIGKIQHKAVEKPPLNRQRTDPKSEAARGPAPSGRDGVRGGAVAQKGRTAGPSASRNGDRSNGRIRSPGAPGARPTPNGKKESAVATEAKKVKKAAVATTGYQGTARPKPNGAKKPGQVSTSSRIADHRSAGGNGSRDYRSRQSRYYEDDEDMDDFIDYDDEEDENGYGGPRYADASDNESDMEAGISDIDEEEHRAEILGRREDREQEALEQRLKLAKEERKQRLLEAMSRRR